MTRAHRRAGGGAVVPAIERDHTMVTAALQRTAPLRMQQALAGMGLA